MAAEIQQKANAVIQKLQQNQVDSIGFGRILLLNNPAEEFNIQKNWEGLFTKGKANVHVEVQLKHKGEIV